MNRDRKADQFDIDNVAESIARLDDWRTENGTVSLKVPFIGTLFGFLAPAYPERHSVGLALKRGFFGESNNETKLTNVPALMSKRGGRSDKSGSDTGHEQYRRFERKKFIVSRSPELLGVDRASRLARYTASPSRTQTGSRFRPGRSVVRSDYARGGV